MKIMALFDESGKIQALFHPSQDPGAPRINFRTAAGHRAETLDVPAEFQHLKPAQLHAAVKVELHKGAPHLVAHKQ